MKTEENIQFIKPKRYAVDWDKVKNFEDFKEVFSTAIRIEIPETTANFESIKHFLKEKQ